MKKPQQHKLIMVGGISANGKSTLAKSLHGHFNAASQKTMLIDSDLVRKVIWYSEKGESRFDETVTLPPEAYSSEFSQKTYDKMAMLATRALNRGMNVIVDATFLSEEERGRFQTLAEKYQAEPHGFWLENDQAILEHRADEREKGVSDANSFVVGLQFKKEFGDVSQWTRIRTDKTAEVTFTKALNALKG